MATAFKDAEVVIRRNAQGVATFVADWIVAEIGLHTRPFRIALSGGNTPRLLYNRLASPEFQKQIDWSRVELFWGDERFVPHDDPQSNFHMARETLLASVPIPAQNVHPIETGGEPQDAADHYDALLRKTYGACALSPTRPLFDLVLLGLGTDGHTASLFPGSAVLDETLRWAAAILDRKPQRITLTYPAIRATGTVLFVVTGEEKADMVRQVAEGNQHLPASRVTSEGRILWCLDSAAARYLKSEAIH